jgi:magnesium chelatase subunit H
MTPKPITAADAIVHSAPGAPSTGVQPLRFVILTMDGNLSGALEAARPALQRDIPGLVVSMHAATDWANSDLALARVRADIASADIIVAGMLFLEDHFGPILKDLAARRDHCDALVCALCAKEVVTLTRIGKFTMDGKPGGALSFLKKLRGNTKKPGGAGAHQMAMLRRLPQILRFIPGTAQDVRAYFLTLQYWLGGSEANIGNMVRYLVGRYADGPNRKLRSTVKAAAPVEYPDLGVYHPSIPGRICDTAAALPATGTAGTVGVLVLRSYLLGGNTEHYDGVIASLEARGLNVIPAFASGLDMRPAIEKFYRRSGTTTVDAVVSLSGFSLVGGPAYNDAKAAEEILATLDVPYVAAHPSEFQTLEAWGASERGLLPVESTIMVAIPELDGATGPMVFGGRSSANGTACTGCHRNCTFSTTQKTSNMHTCIERAEMLADRVSKLVAVRRSQRAARKVAIVLFNFPPNAGNVGTAAYLSVFESLQNTLVAMSAAGYTVDVPASVDDLREQILHGNAAQFGANSNVMARIPVDDHVRRERYLREIEAQWGPAPGRQQSDGATLHVLGARLGNIMVGVQPSIGYEGDPMRLLFERGFAPTHAFSAFYRYIREDFAAHAVLHFGTHGALEFMPGKQAGLSGACWPDRLIGDLPNVYLYASNNPSEGAIAKRRAAATLVSYLTPPVAHAGLYRGLLELKGSVEQFRALPPDAGSQRDDLAVLIQTQAALCELAAAEPVWPRDVAPGRIASLTAEILELEYTLIPHGLHIVGEVATDAERASSLMAIAEASHNLRPSQESLAALAGGAAPAAALAQSGLPQDADMLAVFTKLAATNVMLGEDTEIAGLLKALDGRFIRPAPGGDLLRTPEILPTGRNLHGFDPFGIPSAFAVQDGAKQAQRLIERHMRDTNTMPETIALVLWGSDNLKSEGAPLAQALALVGAKPRFDSYGRLAGATLIPLAELGRPRIDVMVTLSGIFRDLLPLQIKLLAEATFMAASADEPVDQNFVRKHALAYLAANGGDMETAALRVFGNADGAYGSNVNNLLESGRWENEDELADTYKSRKGFAYGKAGRPIENKVLLNAVLSSVDLAYQNLDSVELGVTTVDTYFDTLGGISRAVRKAKGGQAAPVYIGDQTRGEGQVRTLGEQVSLETRTRTLNPKWYEGMLKHGYEGVRQIEVHVTNTMGWSATTGEVAPWVYQQLSETFVLDAAMRDRLARLNPTASAKVAGRLMEAHDRGYWSPDADTLAALKGAQEELEDRLEGIGPDSGSVQSGMEVAA